MFVPISRPHCARVCVFDVLHLSASQPTWTDVSGCGHSGQAPSSALGPGHEASNHGTVRVVPPPLRNFRHFPASFLKFSRGKASLLPAGQPWRPWTLPLAAWTGAPTRYIHIGAGGVCRNSGRRRTRAIATSTGLLRVTRTSLALEYTRPFPRPA